MKPLVGVYPQTAAPESVYIDGVRSGPGPVHEGLKAAVELGSQLVVEPLAWGVVQPRLDVFDWSQQQWWEDACAELAHPPVRTFSLWVTHMWRRGKLPAELVDEPFDSPVFLSSFEAFVEAAAERCGWLDDPPVVLVANEVDLFTDAEPGQTEALLRFLPKAAEILHRIVPGARVTNTVTYTILSKPGGPDVGRRALDGCDIAGFNWYDITSTFPTVLAPRTPVAEVLDRMGPLAAGRPLFLQETGLPAARENHSSDDIQAAFVDELFDALGERSRDEVWGCLWFLLHDFSMPVVLDWLGSELPVLADEPEFLAFLTSLGVISGTGRERPAMTRLRERLRAHAGARST